MKRPALARTSMRAHVGGMMILVRSLLLPCIVMAWPAAALAQAVLPATMEAPRLRHETAVEPEVAPSASPTENSMPAEELACRKRLRDLGVRFEEHDPIKEPQGCEAAHPVTVSRLPGDVELKPEAVLSCAMAEATAMFVRDHASPVTKREFGSSLSAIGNASSYVCRPRNGTSKLSEHAFANALDWASLELADGTLIEVRAYQRVHPRRSRTISALREAACGPFKTVLGPGSDAAHADHFHFDMAARRNGGTFCQ